MANPTAAKLRRKTRRLPEAPESSTDPPADQSPAERPRHDSITRSLLLLPSNLPMSSKPARLFVASLGNPPPLHSTRHSAGHLILRSLVSYLGFPAPHRNAAYAGGHVSASPAVPTYILYQSPTLMNVSGPALLKAWNHFSSLHGRDICTGLVILHDELELPLGQLKLKRGTGSAKGHNGVKSVQSSLQGAGLMDRLGQGFVKVGVGIGRPLSRERDDVSGYVLGQVGVNEKEKIDAAAGELARLLEGEAARIVKG